MFRTLLLSALFVVPALAFAQTAPQEVTAAAAREKRKVSTGAAKPAPRGTPYGSREDALQLADEIAAKRKLDREWVRQLVAQAQQLPVVSRLMQPPPAGTPKNWRVYRSRFIDPIRIQAGVRFWQANRDTLERAEKEFGVPAEIVVGIIGVESIYGQQMGDFRVLDALATLSLDFPTSHPRAAERVVFFRGELEHFLAWHAAAGTDPLSPRGSYAGAMGMPQFMPSSVARWAVDYDGDQRIDLARSPADVIGSVANYFKAFGWQTGMPTHYPVRFDPARLDMESLMAPDILPSFTVPSFQAKGAVLEGEALQHKGPLALVELQNGSDPPQYVAGTENFYVITRYNWSSYYAMSVIELGRSVKDALGRTTS
jgi:membrane-bound lytic murein transglycosylase B